MRQLFHYYVFFPQISHYLTELSSVMPTVNININIFFIFPVYQMTFLSWVNLYVPLFRRCILSTFLLVFFNSCLSILIFHRENVRSLSLHFRKRLRH